MVLVLPILSRRFHVQDSTSASKNDIDYYAVGAVFVANIVAVVDDVAFIMLLLLLMFLS